MTIDEARKRVEKVAKYSTDPEIAHSEEDDFYYDILRWIAAGNLTDAAEIATVALKTKDIYFPRWCA